MVASSLIPASTIDPIGYVLAYVPIALAIIALVLAFVPAIVLLALEGLARSRRRVAGEGEGEGEGEPKPTPA